MDENDNASCLVMVCLKNFNLYVVNTLWTNLYVNVILVINIILFNQHISRLNFDYFSQSIIVKKYTSFSQTLLCASGQI